MPALPFEEISPLRYEMTERVNAALRNDEVVVVRNDCIEARHFEWSKAEREISLPPSTSLG